MVTRCLHWLMILFVGMYSRSIFVRSAYMIFGLFYVTNGLGGTFYQGLGPLNTFCFSAFMVAPSSFPLFTVSPIFFLIERRW
jgi:hypothetical protein